MVSFVILEISNNYSLSKSINMVSFVILEISK